MLWAHNYTMKANRIQVKGVTPSEGELSTALKSTFVSNITSDSQQHYSQEPNTEVTQSVHQKTNGLTKCGIYI